MSVRAKAPVPAAAVAGNGDLVGGPANGRLPAVRRRRRPAVLVLAVVLVGFGALVNAVAVRQGDRVAVLVVARPVPVGQQIAEADLSVVQVAAVPGLATVPAEQRASVVGRYAAVGLRPGSLLTADAVTVQRAPLVGQAVLAVAVKTGLVPARGLDPGDRVVLVPVSGDQPTQPAADSAPVHATVVEVGQPDSTGAWAVDVAVDERLAAELADAAASGRLALVLLPAGS
jgi:hypothetical protein